MRLVGSLTNLVRTIFKVGSRQVTVEPAAQTVGDATLTIPDLAGTGRSVVTDTGTQTLSNKTLTSPVINSPTGLAKADVGLGNVDNTSDATKNAAAVALTNKTSIGVDNLSLDGNTLTTTSGALNLTSEAAAAINLTAGTDLNLTAGSGDSIWAFSDLILRPGKLLRLQEPAGGPRAVDFVIPNTLSASRTITFPDADGTVGLVPALAGLLRSDGGGALIVGSVDLSSEVTDALPIANGGTGQVSKTAAFDALAPTTTQGDTIYYNGTDNVRLAKGSAGQVLTMNAGATAPEWTDGGGGSGEKNYITNHSAKSAITGWTAVGDLDVARTTTAAELPREFTTAAGIKITADANTQSVADYVYYDFTLDDVDLSKKLKIQWAQKVTGTYAAGDLEVVITTQADRTTALHTPITTAIPSADGVFTTSFDASTTAALSLVIRATTDMDTDGGIVISDVIVGPGIQPQGAVVGEWQSYTPTGNDQWTANATYYGRYRRVGDSMELQLGIAAGASTPTGGNTGATRISLPSGYTIDPTKMISSTANESSLGHWQGTIAGVGNIGGFVRKHTSNAQVELWRIKPDASDYKTAMDAMSASDITNGGAQAAEVYAFVTVPIAEWAGSGTVNLAQNDVEYASNDGSGGTTAGATYSTGMVYGPSGAAFVAVGSATLNSNTIYKVSFTTPIQASDKVEIETSQDSGVTWQTDGGSVVHTYRTIQNTSNYGMFIVKNDSTSVHVYFGNYGRHTDGATFSAAGAAWGDLTGGTYRWRVRKSSGGQAVGFGEVAQSSSGLVKSAGQLKGTNTNDSAASGYVGEVIEQIQSSIQAPAASGSYKQIDSKEFPAGDWEVTVDFYLDTSGMTSPSNLLAAFSTTTASSSGTTFLSTNMYGIIDGPTGIGACKLGPFQLSLASATTYYVNGRVAYSGSPTQGWKSRIHARRAR